MLLGYNSEELTVKLVVVAMSGGVDSSVTARILANKVGTPAFHLSSSTDVSRDMIYLPSSCAIGIRVTSQELIRAVNGRETGRTYNVSARHWIYLVKWSVI
jgi:NH3-dependent NAD+ synthetase